LKCFQKVEIYFFLARYCPDPPAPPENGGLYDWDLTLADKTPFATKVKFLSQFTLLQQHGIKKVKILTFER
jgi:hypothetical protein